MAVMFHLLLSSSADARGVPYVVDWTSNDYSSRILRTLLFPAGRAPAASPGGAAARTGARPPCKRRNARHCWAASVFPRSHSRNIGQRFASSTRSASHPSHDWQAARKSSSASSFLAPRGSSASTEASGHTTSGWALTMSSPSPSSSRSKRPSARELRVARRRSQAAFASFENRPR